MDKKIIKKDYDITKLAKACRVLMEAAGDIKDIPNSMKISTDLTKVFAELTLPLVINNKNVIKDYDTYTKIVFKEAYIGGLNPTSKALKEKLGKKITDLKKGN